ncbi:class I adenylate-forming enzyme family protein [Streptomyces reniochalinae]|uniref:Fatty acid--CoA ligase n=1 Tax=Streptomyces reniochalinae TaxID=2250578 RepID=A0A367EDM0_9ACTN|nr:fatty acid--CoA ligase family protein [Streptomyces reniochalinae]RCG16176.1 fatty acid--CoA ligase [Streptomyces reniochalinae]
MTSSHGWWSRIGGYAADIMSVLADEPERIVAHWRDRRFSARELTGSVTGTYRAMRTLDVGPGSVVGILVAPNSPDMLTARYAAHLLGAAVCYLRTTNPGSNAAALSAADQLRMLRETHAAVVYADDENHARALELADGAGGGITVLGPAAEGDVPASEAVTRWDPQRLAVVGYTSGSTGRPKGIRMSGRAWEGTVRITLAPETDPIHLLVTTPLSHTVGPMADAAVTSRGTLVLREEFRAERFADDIAEHGVTRAFMATAHLYRLHDHLADLDAPERTAAALATLRHLVYSGSSAAPARVADAVRLFGPRLLQAYGTSEGGRVTLLDPGEHYDPWLSTTVGRPFPEVEISLYDTESGARVSPGEVGEVWMRSPHLMDGYWNDDDLTARVLRDGWYATGDIGYLDERGYLHLLGRTSEVVKVNGVKIHPTVVEQEILAIDGVRHAAVYGWRDDDAIESLHAAVAFQPGSAPTADEIRKHVSTSLSAAHAPSEIFVLDELPTNHSGKADKVLLRSLHSRRAHAPHGVAERRKP